VQQLNNKLTNNITSVIPDHAHTDHCQRLIWKTQSLWIIRGGRVEWFWSWERLLTDWKRCSRCWTVLQLIDCVGECVFIKYIICGVTLNCHATHQVHVRRKKAIWFI